MPATEKTWRDTKLLHVVFGLSALLMLLVTLWMLIDDHDREWRRYQRTFYEQVEVWNLQGRILEQLALDYQAGLDERKTQLYEQQQQVPEPPLVELFNAEQLFYSVYTGLKDSEKEEDRNKADELAEEYANFVATTSAALTEKEAVATMAVQLANLSSDAAREKDKQRKAEMNRHSEAPKKSHDQQAEKLQATLKQVDEARNAWEKKFRQQVKEYNDQSVHDPSAVADIRGLSGRSELLSAMRKQIADARFTEEYVQRDLKFRRADLDVVRSDFGLRLGEGASQDELTGLQNRVTAVLGEVGGLNDEYTSLKRHRTQLDAVLKAITAGEDAAQKAVDQFEANVKRLESQRETAESNWGKTTLGIPILDAFDNSQISLKHVGRWLPELTLDRNFNQVARFDRCEACHLGVLKADPDDPLAPGYEHEHPLEVKLQMPGKAPEVAETDAAGNPLTPKQIIDAKLRQAYGFRFSDLGLFNDEDVMIEFVLPETRGADAQLQRGDVIVDINGEEVQGKDARDQVLRTLLEPFKWGQTLTLNVRRGVPHPYSTHPRLDLYGTDLSPHPFGTFGCTICHDGQGNGTAFKWASHTPDSLTQAKEWARDLGWFDNLHWIYPMRPQRFAESNCLKCHYGLSELESSERFPETPAPNLMEGYHTVRKFGCFGCHEIKGYDGPDKRIGPDLRLEPNYFAAADQLRYLLGKQIKPWEAKSEPVPPSVQEVNQKAFELRDHPDDDKVRHDLQHLLATDAARPQPLLGGAVHSLASLFKDQETPGQMRKVGPSLRHVDQKLDEWFIYNQIKNPQGFRPASRMPKLFGLFSHFNAGKDYGSKSNQGQLKETEDLEEVEILSIVKYVVNKSQPIDLPEGEWIDAPPVDKLVPIPGSEDPLSRGKFLFQTRCLACHKYKDFPQGAEDQGPDLSHVGDKLAGKNGENLKKRGRKWLYNWLRHPTNYHARTRMPDNFLSTPLEEKDAAGKLHTIDPALEITEFLLASRAGKDGSKWDPVDVPRPKLDDEFWKNFVVKLAIEHLRGASGFTESQATNYLNQGIPASLAAELKGDEVELLQDASGKFNRQQQTLNYLGRRTISKYGCYGCHDVPGFEGAQPIGTGLADWGRKETSKIAFEQINMFIDLTESKDADGGHPGGGHHLKLDDFPDQDKAYFLNSLIHHQREGFLWQKLRDPRSFDYEKTQNKGYNERLKMPQFSFDPDEKENTRLREKVMTFVLGLVSEPPPDKYVYRPEPRRAAINEGRRVLTKYNCGGCHTLEMGTWRIEFPPDDPVIGTSAAKLDQEFPFLHPTYPADAFEKSRHQNKRGMLTATIVGRRTRSPNDGKLLRQDVEVDGRDAYQIGIELWKPAVIGGYPYMVGNNALVIEENAQQLRPPTGGTLARMLPPVLLADAIRRRENVKTEIDVLRRVPPVLVGEGRKVRSDWLHDFLLDPYMIRPQAALRMPKFNMSEAEANILANYFAAIDDAEYPYTFNPRRRIDLSRPQQRERLEDAHKIITNSIYCLQCHRMGNFQPERTDQAPDLAQVYRRLRGDFLREWIANPALKHPPDPGMPKYFNPFATPEPTLARKKQFAIDVGPLIEKGTALEQIDAVTDYLLNYDRFAAQKQNVKVNISPQKKGVAGGG